MMNAITKYERRHSIHNDDISLGIAGVDDWSIDTTSICSTSSIFDDATDNSTQKRSMPQHYRWKIDASEISELPEIYPRLSSPLIVRDREISEIGDHLWRFLRANEIRSAYDREEGRVLCCTNRVSFVVQFWRRKLSQEDDESNTAQAVASEYFPTIHDHTPKKKNSSSSNSDDDEEEIILEIQRRKGCSWTMHKIRSAMKKWILRKQQQQCPGGSHYHHCNEKGMSRFPPPLQRSKSERFGLVGFDPVFLASNITPLRLHDRILKPIATTTAQDVVSSTPFFTPPTATIRKPCSVSMPPIRPAFESLPPPVWCSAKISPSEEHRFTTIQLKD